MSEKQYPCDKCGEGVPVIIKERNHSGLVIESYLQCPHCDEEFISFVTDQHARKERDEVRKLRERLAKRQGKLSIHMEKLKSEIMANKVSE